MANKHIVFVLSAHSLISTPFTLQVVKILICHKLQILKVVTKKKKSWITFLHNEWHIVQQVFVKFLIQTSQVTIDRHKTHMIVKCFLAAH